MVLLFVLSAQPSLPAPPGPFNDKQVHASAYALLAALWVRALAGGRWDGVTGGTAAAAAVVAILYAATDEVHQLFVTGRTADLADLVADAIGAIGAALTLWLCAIIAARRRLRPADSSR
jgi:VanZ family protein